MTPTSGNILIKVAEPDTSAGFQIISDRTDPISVGFVSALAEDYDGKILPGMKVHFQAGVKLEIDGEEFRITPVAKVLLWQR